ncbi:hypothetical protein TURU_085883 [Turdus rufiventris]|nr:hypothetical protein TURU_085883 [Turdus rufiventris]
MLLHMAKPFLPPVLQEYICLTQHPVHSTSINVLSQFPLQSTNFTREVTFMNKLIACSKLGAKWDNRITLHLHGMDGRVEADSEENHQISVFKPPHIQCKPVSGPQEYQKPPQTIIHGVDEGDQRSSADAAEAAEPSLHEEWDRLPEMKSETRITTKQ